MRLVFNITLLALCLGIAAARSTKTMVHAKSFEMIEMVMRAQGMNRLSSESMACFDYYNPILIAINDEYQESYGMCEDEAVDALKKIDESTAPQREEIERDVDQSYEVLNACKESANSVEYFECYENAATSATKALYGVSVAAADTLVSIREQYRVVEFQEGRCKDTADRVYVLKWSTTFDDLQNCLAGKATPPPPTQPTQPTDPTDPPTESTAPAETTTTEAPVPTTTMAPETTVPEEVTDDSGDDSDEKSGLPEEDLSSESADSSDDEKNVLRKRLFGKSRRV